MLDSALLIDPLGCQEALATLFFDFLLPLSADEALVAEDPAVK
jgi:hypothetical protein